MTRHILSQSTFHKCTLCERKFKRQDYLKKHLLRHQQQTGGHVNSSFQSNDSLYDATNSVMSDRPRTPSFVGDTTPVIENHEPTHTLMDHNYTRAQNRNYLTNCAINEDQSLMDLNYSMNSVLNENRTMMDHDYARDNSFQFLVDHSYSINSALNDAVKDYTIVPNNNEKFDLLTFFANVKTQVRNLLFDRLKSNGIKWYLSIQVELVKDSFDRPTSTPHFRSKTYATLNIANLEDQELNESFQKMFESFEKYIRDSSGWLINKVIHLIVHTIKFTHLTGSSFMELPKDLRRFIRNLDNKCFLWSCLAAIHELDSPLVSDYEKFENELNMQGIDYPVTINKINKFENQNLNISVNVFTYDDQDILPLCITKQKCRQNHINLLLLQSESNSHYCLITNMNRFFKFQKKKSYYTSLLPLLSTRFRQCKAARRAHTILSNSW